MKTQLTRDHRAQLEALRRAYEEGLPQRVRAIEEAAAALSGPVPRPEALEAAYHLVHRLNGSAAIYGFEAVRRTAAELETRLVSAMESGVLSGAWDAELALHLEALRRAVSAPPAEGEER
jgi:HPt (histidine-containing phosphotransfer) domain-containing protein